MVWHHISGVVGIILGISAGFAMPGISNLCLLAEISTIFINYRSLYDKKDFGNFGPQALQIIFFFTFTIFRMILIPCTLPYFYEDYKLSWDLRSGVQKFCWVVGFAQFMLLWALNLYWYYLIYKGIRKVLGYDKKEVMDSSKCNEKLHNY